MTSLPLLLSRFHVVASSPALRKKKENGLPLVADDVVSTTTLERRSFTPNMRHTGPVFFFFFFSWIQFCDRLAA